MEHASLLAHFLALGLTDLIWCQNENLTFFFQELIVVQENGIAKATN